MSVLPNVTVECLFGIAWVDVSAYVRGGQITRGSTRYDGALVRYEASTASVVLDNRDGRFDPTNLSGPYVWANGSQVLPETPWRIRSTYGSGYNLWLGYADSWQLDYPNNGKDAICTLTGTDWSKQAQALGYSAAEPATVASGTLVSDLVTAHGITAVVDTGDSVVQGGQLVGVNVWGLLQQIADSELGELYVRGDGAVVFRHRNALYTDARSTTPQATFGDSGAELRYTSLRVVNDDLQLINNAITQTVGGTQQQAFDSNSITQFGTRAYSRTDLLLTTDADALQQAGYLVGVTSGAKLLAGTNFYYGDPRVEQITIDPRPDPTNLNPQVLGRDLGDRITVKARPVGRGAINPINRDAWIRGIQHTFGPDSWQTTWTLQDTAKFNVLVLNQATLGRIDYNVFGW